MDHLLHRLAVDRPSIVRSLVKLLYVSYQPISKEGEVQVMFSCNISHITYNIKTSHSLVWRSFEKPIGAATIALAEWQVGCYFTTPW